MACTFAVGLIHMLGTPCHVLMLCVIRIYVIGFIVMLHVPPIKA